MNIWCRVRPRRTVFLTGSVCSNINDIIITWNYIYHRSMIRFVSSHIYSSLFDTFVIRQIYRRKWHQSRRSFIDTYRVSRQGIVIVFYIIKTRIITGITCIFWSERNITYSSVAAFNSCKSHIRNLSFNIIDFLTFLITPKDAVIDSYFWIIDINTASADDTCIIDDGIVYEQSTVEEKYRRGISRIICWGVINYQAVDDIGVSVSINSWASITCIVSHYTVTEHGVVSHINTGTVFIDVTVLNHEAVEYRYRLWGEIIVLIYDAFWVTSVENCFICGDVSLF